MAKNIKFNKLKYYWKNYWFIIPSLLLISVFAYTPAISAIYHSFFRWNGGDIEEWIGFRNYFEALTDPVIWRGFRVIFILIMANFIKLVPSIITAVVIHRISSQKWQYYYRVAFVIPMIIPVMVYILMWKFFYDPQFGPLNTLLNYTGLMSVLRHLDTWFNWGAFTAGINPAWLSNPKLIIPALIIWGFPWVGVVGVLIYLAGLQNISQSVYEAADIDGAGWFRKFWNVELPLLVTQVRLNLVLMIIATLKSFGIILVLLDDEGGPGGVALVPGLYMFKMAFKEARAGYACAIGLILFFLILILTQINNRYIKSDVKPDFFTNYLGKLKKNSAFIFFLVLWLLSKFFSITELISSTFFFTVLFIMVLETNLPGIRKLNYFVKTFFDNIFSPLRTLKNAWDIKKWEKFQLKQMVKKKKNWLTQSTRKLFAEIFKHSFVWFVLLFAFFPLYLMVVISLKDNQQFAINPLTLSEPFHFENWIYGWNLLKDLIANSVVVAVFSVSFTLILGTFGAYFFARFKMPGSTFLWYFFLILMLMPGVANLITLFKLLANLKMLNSLSTLIVLGTTGGQIFTIYVMKNFIEDIPNDLFDAADVDGASHLNQIINIVLPMSGSILSTVAILQFVAQWNNFILPLVIMRDPSKLTIPVGLMNLSGEYIKFWGPMMSGYVIASVPLVLLFIFTMRLFVKGLTAGAIKG